MSRYNYFDDDDEIEARFNADGKPRFSLDYIKSRADAVVYGMAHNETLEELSALPNLKRAILKFLAFLMLVVAVALAVLIFAHNINSNNDRLEKYRKDAAKVCTQYITKYGAVRWEKLDSSVYGENKARLTGLCYARQMDFDDDGNAELMLCYYNNNTYYLEVWGYVDKKFSKIYSEEANSTKNSKDGCWVGFFHKNNKYYICKSEKESPESVELYTMKGDTFKSTGKCDYDYENDIYAVRGRINARDFETIRLSGFRSSKGEVLTELVTNTIDGFGNVSKALLENQKSQAQLKSEAYYSIIEARIEKYGNPDIKRDDSCKYINGLAVVRLIDFDADGNEELFLCYRKMKKISKYDYGIGQNIYYEEPGYSMEVYNWNGTMAKRIFSKDSVSSFLNDRNVYYTVFTEGGKKTDICNNTYSFENSYYYTASSKIYRLKKNEKFETVFSAGLTNDYGYRSYTLDGERVYSSTFEQKGYRVPYFMNDEDTYSSKNFTVIFVSGRDEDKFQSTIDDTVKTIKSLNSNYSPKEK